MTRMHDISEARKHTEAEKPYREKIIKRIGRALFPDRVEKIINETTKSTIDQEKDLKEEKLAVVSSIREIKNLLYKIADVTFVIKEISSGGGSGERPSWPRYFCNKLDFPFFINEKDVRLLLNDGQHEGGLKFRIAFIGGELPFEEFLSSTLEKTGVHKKQLEILGAIHNGLSGALDSYSRENAAFIEKRKMEIQEIKDAPKRKFAADAARSAAEKLAAQEIFLKNLL